MSLSVKEAAAIIGIHPNTLYECAATGEIPALKIRGKWIFDADTLRAWKAEEQARQTEERRRRHSLPVSRRRHRKPPPLPPLPH